ESDVEVMKRIQPVGQVKLAAASGPKVQMTGEQVFNQVCKICHEAGVAGAPKVGDKAAWAKVIKQGLATVVEHATTGIRGMPAKGGNPDLEGVEGARAVVFMANKGGASWKEPAGDTAPAAPAAATSTPAPAAAASTPAPAADAAPAPAATAKVDGKKV